MGRIEMTYEIAMAAGRDAGNGSMREGSRTAWSVEDWDAACETFERLWPQVPVEAQQVANAGPEAKNRF